MGIEKNVLEQYTSIKEEIIDLERRNKNDRNEIKKLEKQIMSDTVTGSRDDLTIGPIPVRGIAESLIEKKQDRIRNRMIKQLQHRQKLEGMKEEIEDYIQKIEDSEIRRIARFRYIDGLKWKEVAVRMGKGYSEDFCRIKMENFLKK